MSLLDIKFNHSYTDSDHQVRYLMTVLSFEIKASNTKSYYHKQSNASSVCNIMIKWPI